MNDAEYTLMQTNRERKALSRNAKYKRNGSRSKKCTLPSDHLTPAQKKGLNGMAQTYTMNEPDTLRELRLWPADIRHEYMEGLLERYNPSNKDLGMMLNCGPTYPHTTLPTHFGITRGRGGSHQTTEQSIAWSRFIGGEEPTLALAPEEPKVVMPDEEPVLSPTIAPTHLHSPLTYDHITLQFTGTSDDLIDVIQRGPIHLTGADTYTFTITATRKGAE